MKAMDVTMAILVVVGALNWGLVGILGFDLVAALLGEMSSLSRVVYALVGVAGLYQALQFKRIQDRWSAHGSAISLN